MFKLESFVTPLLAHYLNKYIKDLTADDLQLSLWKGEAVLNNLDLRLDVIEEDLGLPFTFVSGSIQELRIKVPWTRLTAERVVITVNTMECVLKLSSGSRAGDGESADKSKTDRKPTEAVGSSPPPPPGYMESLTTRVLNNVQIHFTNLILRYIGDDFTLNVLVKNANYFTVNEKWEKAFVEVSQQDLSLRKILVIQDLHVSLGQHGSEAKDTIPVVERTFITCRFLQKFDSTDCRLILSLVTNVLCDELYVTLMDVQLPVVRRLVDLILAFQAGELKAASVPPKQTEEEFLDAVLLEPVIETAPVAAPPSNSSWASWALSFIPTGPGNAGLEPGSETAVRDSGPVVVLPRAATVGVYTRKINVTISMQGPPSGKGHRVTRRPFLRLEAENAFLTNKNREAKFSNFRAAIGVCRLVSLNGCPCGEVPVSADDMRPILSFTDYENPPSERPKLLSGSLFSNADDEKEVTDGKAPFTSYENYLSCNTEVGLLKTYGVIVLDSVNVIEPGEDFTGDLGNMSLAELEQSNLKQNAKFRVIISPLVAVLDSASVHRFDYLIRHFQHYSYPPYGQPQDFCAVRETMVMPDELRQIHAFLPLKSLDITVLKPTIVLSPPSHVSMPEGLVLRRGAESSTARNTLKDSPALVLQAERVESHQISVLYPNRILHAALDAKGLIGETLKHHCYNHWKTTVTSVEFSLGSLLSGLVPFRDMHTLILPINLEFKAKWPIERKVCEELWGRQDHSVLSCPGAQLGVSLSELLLTHLCVSGLLNDMGSYLSHRTFQTVAQQVFDPSSQPENGMRLDVKCSKISVHTSSIATGSTCNGRLGSVELTVSVTDNRGATSPFLRDRASDLAQFSFVGAHQEGRMRVAAYNVCLRSIVDAKAQETLYALQFPTATKVTIYPNFIPKLAQNVGTCLQYHRDITYANLYRDTTNEKAPVQNSDQATKPVCFEVNHEKISLEVLDPEFEFLAVSINTGKISSRTQHLNITSYSYEMRALLVKLGRSSRDPVIGPVSGKLDFESFGADLSTISFAMVDLTLFPVRLGPHTVNMTTRVVRQFIDVYQVFLENVQQNKDETRMKFDKRYPEHLRFVGSCDDLRSRDWLYVESGDAELDDAVPNVGEIRFRETQKEQSMCWRYAEIRTITSVAVIPIPFQTSETFLASGLEVGVALMVSSFTVCSSNSLQIVCSLQYLKRPTNQFTDVRSFTLMECKECQFRFPDVVPEDSDRLPISDVWRVKVSYSIQHESVAESLLAGGSKFPISVKSLAGCMKINSSIILGMPTSFQAALGIGVASLALIHHVPMLAKTPGHSLISGFVYDSSYPSDQEFARFKFDKVSLNGRVVKKDDSIKLTLDSSFWFESDFVNYRFLTLQPLVESCFLSSSVSYTMEDKMFVQAKIDSKTPWIVHCGQNMLHSFSMAKIAWEMAQAGRYPSLPIMNHLVVCNDTHHVIRVRQYKTDECIFIRPKEMHPYSWRSQRMEQQLQFSVETYPNLWSEPCAVAVSTQLCSFPAGDELDVGLVCTVRALNNIQKQVLLATEFMIRNQLDSDIEVQMFTEPDYVSNPLVEVPQEPIVVQSESSASSRCIPVRKFKRCKVRLRGGIWSDNIVLTAGELPSYIQVPETSEVFRDVLVTYVTTAQPIGCRWLILSPVACGKNCLPHPLAVKFIVPDSTPSHHAAAPYQVFQPPVPRVAFTMALHYTEAGETSQEVQIDIASILAQLPARSSVVDPAVFLGEQLVASEKKTSHRRNKEPEPSPRIVTKDFVVEFRRLFSFVDTLQFSILPNGINVENEYDDDLVVYGVDDELVLAIPRKSSVVLPFTQKGQIRLGVQNGDTIYLSECFDIRASQVAREPGMDCTAMGLLPCGGHLTVTFWEKREEQFLIHHLTLVLKDEKGMKSLLISSRFVAVQTTPEPMDVLLSAFVVPRVHAKMNYVDELQNVPSDKLSRHMIPLSPFVYVVPKNHPIETEPNRAADLAMFVCVASETPVDLRWSYPKEIGEPKNKKVSTVTLNVPSPTGTLAGGLCFKTTVLEEGGVCYLVFEKVEYPNLVFVNNCAFPLVFGECVRKGSGIVTFEEKQMFLPLPIVDAGGFATYTFPTRDESFPAVSATNSSNKLRLGRLVQTGAQSSTAVWSSTSVDPFASQNDCFISIPGVCYLKLHFERQHRHTVRILVDPLSRVGTPILLPLTPTSSVTSSEFPPYSSCPSTPATPLPPAGTSAPLNLGVSCLFKSVIFTVDDEITDPNVIAEVLRLSLDDVSLQLYCDGHTEKTYECAVNIGDLQLDNQLYSCGFFDFPVILAKENPKKNVQSALNLLCKLNSGTLRPENVHVSLAPVCCFVEDSFVYHLLRLVDSYLAPALLVSGLREKASTRDLMIAKLQKLTIPVIMERIHVAPVEVYLSIHAKLKMFVALDRTPLSFNEIVCSDVNSTVEEVWNFVSSHYVRGTLLRAGWVIGSMDLLGNPASLLRSLSSGCSDLFVRPFTSLHTGPVSFLQDIAEGASSFLTSISAGTISSVTNLAESVSRNLDQISLDDEHVLRQMEVKYRDGSPEGLASGLKQGMTGFGMSLLGAVAGLVDQPMQAVMQDRLTPAQFVTALMMGVTRGVVGAMSKPIAGAAGLVSKTGQGILRGNGLLSFPPRRCVIAPKLAGSFMESTLKYIWKVAPLLPNTVQTLCVVEATPVSDFSSNDPPDSMCLFLTDSALFVISSADDEFRQAYSLSKLDIRVSPSPDSQANHRDFIQVTILIEPDVVESENEPVTEDTTAWPWLVWNDRPVVISPAHSASNASKHYTKESYLLEWKDAKLFEELFYVAKSSV